MGEEPVDRVSDSLVILTILYVVDEYQQRKIEHRTHSLSLFGFLSQPLFERKIRKNVS